MELPSRWASEIGSGNTSPPTRSSPWLRTAKSPNRRTWRLYGSSGLCVKVTPDPDSRLRLPKTMRCTTTAVPHSSATPVYWR